MISYLEFCVRLTWSFYFSSPHKRLIYFQLIERFTQLSVCVALVTCIIIILGAMTWLICRVLGNFRVIGDHFIVAFYVYPVLTIETFRLTYGWTDTTNFVWWTWRPPQKTKQKKNTAFPRTKRRNNIKFNNYLLKVIRSPSQTYYIITSQKRLHRGSPFSPTYGVIVVHYLLSFTLYLTPSTDTILLTSKASILLSNSHRFATQLFAIAYLRKDSSYFLRFQQQTS